MAEITELLQQWRNGSNAALERAVALLYPELRKQAQASFARYARGELSIGVTELAHESYLRLMQQDLKFENRLHFLALFAQAMRRVLIDLWRDRQTDKRSNSPILIGLHAVELQNATLEMSDALEFAQLLEQLERRDRVAAKVIELRFIAGMSNTEAAKLLKIGVATANRHFAFARAWLMKRLNPKDLHKGGSL